MSVSEPREISREYAQMVVTHSLGEPHIDASPLESAVRALAEQLVVESFNRDTFRAYFGGDNVIERYCHHGC